MSREAAIARAAQYFDDEKFLADLARRVAFKTESQMPESRPHLAAYLEREILPAFERMGFSVRIVPNPVASGGPFLIATRLEEEKLPTVLAYGHADVIRGLEPQWRAGLDPWKLTVEGERWYGRGTADNKSQHLINMLALEQVIAERGRLGFNCKFLIETGEEIGSPDLRQVCEQYREELKADLLLASDGPRLSADRPTLFLGCRGGIRIHLNVNLREGAHHSGNWGGVLANPATILAAAITSLVDGHGRSQLQDFFPGYHD